MYFLLQLAGNHPKLRISCCNLQEEINVKDLTLQQKQLEISCCNLQEEKNPDRRLAAICRKRYKKKEEGECLILKTKIL